MAITRKLTVEIVGDVKGAARAFKDTEKATSSWSKKLGGVAGKVAVGLGGVGIAAGAMGLQLVHAAEDSNRVTAQSAAVIKSTGGAAHLTAKQVADLSEKLSAKAGIDDELIQSGENVLLTFTNVRNEVGKGNDIFTKATGLALDMSTALGTDMQSSVIQLGKALNDPIKGITALQRVGVSFTQQQKDQIAALVRNHDLLGAQKVILGELSKEFGGSAEAQATASGKLSVAWGNLQETLGEKLLPVVQKFSDWAINTGIPAVEKLAGWLEKHKGITIALAAVIGGVLLTATIAWAAAMIVANAPIILIGVAIGALVFLVVKHWDTIKRVTVTTFNAVKGAIMAAFNWVKRNWPLLVAIITGPIGVATLAVIRNWDRIKAGVSAVKRWIVDRFNDVVGFIRGLPGRIGRAVAGMWNGLVSGFRRAINSIIAAWNRLSFTIGGGHYDPLGRFGPSISVPAFTFNTPNLSYLAEGGIVKRTPGGVLARIGEGRTDEAVIPLDGRRLGGDTYHIHLDMRGAIVADDRQFRRMVAKASNDLLAQGGLTVRGRRIQ